MTIHTTDRPANRPAAGAYDGWTIDLHPMWSMARHRCGHVNYLPNPTAEDVARHVQHHQCRPGADRDPVLAQPVTAEIDLGPVSELVFGSMALLVETLPYGLLDRHPLLRAQAERLVEGLSSHLDTPEPPDAGPGDVVMSRAALHARRLAGVLGPDEPVYVSVGELDQTAGRLPALANGTKALGVMWVGPDDISGPETCARHLIDQVLPGELQRHLDPSALGLVLYDDVDCSTCPPTPQDSAEDQRRQLGAAAPLEATYDGLEDPA